MAWTGLGGLFLVILYGSYMVGIGYGAICSGWPLCLGERNPAGTPFLIHMIHRYMVASGGCARLSRLHRGMETGRGAGATALDGGTHRRIPSDRDRCWGVYSVVGFIPRHSISAPDVRQSVVGVDGADDGGPLQSRNIPGEDHTREGRRMTRASHHVSSVLGDYVALTKPRIISLLLITAVGSMFLAAEGWPDPLLTALVVVGGYLAAGGANALNHSLESGHRPENATDPPSPGSQR